MSKDPIGDVCHSAESCETGVPIVVDAEHGKLNYFDPEAYPSSMSQLLKTCDMTEHDTVGECLQVDNHIDLRLPNLNDPFSESAVDVCI